MDRDLIYPGQIGLVENFLDAFKSSMIGIAATSEAILGQTTQVAGLAATALSNTAVSGSPFAIAIGRGFIFAFEETDPNAYGVLGADTATSILKTGINLSATQLAIAASAPAIAGQSVNYLVSAAFEEQDTNSTNLPFYNAGGAPTITVENATRRQTVVFEVAAGAAAATGSQTTPSVPAGYVPLYVVTVTNGQTAVASGNISVAPGAPFITTLTKISSAAAKAHYRANQPGTIYPATGSTNTLASVSVTFPAFSKSGAFRVRGRMIQQGAYIGSGGSRQNFIASLSDGTNQIGGAYWLFSPVDSGDALGFSDYFESSVTYAPGATVIFTMSTTTLGGNSSVFSINNSFFELFMEEA